MRESYLVRSKTFEEIKLSDFNFLKMLGRGSFGKVYLAKLEKKPKIICY